MSVPRSAGFTLVEILIVVAIIGLLAAIAIPSFQRARAESQRDACMHNMRSIESAKTQWALANNAAVGTAVTWSHVLQYLRRQPACPASGTYEQWEIGAPIYCTVHD